MTAPANIPLRLRWRALRYSVSLIGPVLGFLSLSGDGWVCWAFPIYAFGFVPLRELLAVPDHRNLSTAEEEVIGHDRFFDMLLYLMVPIVWGLLGFFLWRMARPDQPWMDMLGRILSMGIVLGVYAINVGHELGHRSKAWERDLARALLTASLYAHFIIEHNRGHHRHVATPQDPASARFGEPIYAFWPRTIVHSFRSAWRLEAERLAKEGRTAWDLRNEMLRGCLVEGAVVLGVSLLFGAWVMLAYLIAALIGILLLETVNYIEHYGLGRMLNAHGRPVRVAHVHSWNSDHPLGRLMLFELTRHSDHHFRASRKYQTLRSIPESPQMPTGYPGMMLLSLVPPLWFRVMHPRIDALVAMHGSVVRVAREV
ncbi:MAG: alkane 1-monooxygenase [Flavobacteriales bacterium]|nr:alkane 1-monooxygenase [Flavobacteriales bacterium]